MESRRHLSKGLAALSAALVTVVLSARPALATAPATGPVAQPSLTPSVQLVQPGEPVTVTGSGFTQCMDSAGNTTVDLSANGTPLATASGSNGDFQQVITVPPASPAGPYPVTAQCSAKPDINLTSTNVSVVTLALSLSSGTPGTVIGVTGGGFTQCREVQLQLLQDARQAVAAGSLVVPANGSFTTGVTVPSSAAPGNDYQVDAGCYPAADGNAPMAIEQFTVTPSGSLTPPPTSPTPRLTSPTPASSTTPSSTRSGAGSPSSTSPTARLRPTLSSSSGSPPPPPPPAPSAPPSGRADGLGEPVALVGGTSAGLALVALLLVRALSMVHGRRGRGWVNKHLRVAAGWARPLSARVERRRGAMSVSVGLQPHFDGLRNTQNEEAAR